MKNLQTFVLIGLTFFLFSFTKGGYEKAMEATIAEMNQINGVEGLQASANKFERIASAEKNKWLPYYYQAYCHVMMTTQEKDITKWDGYLDKADNLLDKAEKLKKPDMVEILALKGFANMMRINVDPSTRGQEYSMKSAGYLQQANLLDSQNPRVSLMMAQMLYGTAQFFGKGTEEACQKFWEANLLFEKEEAKGKGIQPSWGKPNVVSMLKRCGSSIEDK